MKAASEDNGDELPLFRSAEKKGPDSLPESQPSKKKQQRHYIFQLIAGTLIVALGLLAFSRLAPGRPVPFPPAPNPPRPPLAFPSSGLLKLAILSDLHFFESPKTKWGPEQDINTTRAIHAILDAEKPDFVVFAGDQVTGEFMQPNQTAFFGRVFEILQKRGIPWASCYGNHDQGPVSKSNGTFDPAFPLSLLTVEQSYSCAHTRRGPASLKGTTNYVLPILAGAKAVVYLWFLDSLLTSVTPDQLSWLKSTHSSLPNAKRATHMMFVHIPTDKVRLQETKLFRGPGPKCKGLTAEKKPNYQDDDGALFATLAQLNFSSVYSGHDHGTTWACNDPATGVMVVMNRHTGYGGYGNWERGARIVELSERGALRTWVRMEDGKVLEQ